MPVEVGAVHHGGWLHSESKLSIELQTPGQDVVVGVIVHRNGSCALVMYPSSSKDGIGLSVIACKYSRTLCV